MLRNWPLSRTSYDVSATDLSVTPRTVADPALQLEPHHPIDFGTTDGIRASPFDGVGTFGDFTGTGGKDHLIGTADDDSFDVSQGGNDTIEGGDGDDNVYFGASLTAKDKVYGGANNSYEVSNGDTVELEGDYSGGLTIGASTLTDIELVWLYGASFGNGGGSYAVKLNDASVAAGGYMQWIGFQSSTGTDHFDINGSAETDGDLSLQTYGRGADHLTGGGGNDFINGGVSGNDVLNGGGGWNRVSFSRAVTGATGGVTVSLAMQGHPQDVGGGRMVTLKNFQGLSGSARDDVLTGDKNDNYIFSGGGNDTLHGGKGNDLLLITGSATIYAATATGDAGSDTVAFSSTRGGVVFSLDLQGTAQAGVDGTINASGFENAAGTNTFGDVITGNSAANKLYGDGGNDVLIGGAGNDFLYGDKAVALIATDAASIGASGFGDVDRGTGDDLLRGGIGDDLLDGGVGVDTADYSDATGGGVVVDLNILTAQAVGGGLGSDMLSGIEILTGSSFGDTLTGDGNANGLSGRDGDDTLAGGDGDDFLDGGSDNDNLNGGAGADILVGDQLSPVVATAFHLVSTTADGTPGEGQVFGGVLSSDGTKVVFLSNADNLDGEDTHPHSPWDVFVKDLVTGEVVRITGGDANLPNTESYEVSFSPDGTKIGFSSSANGGFGNAQSYVYDLTTETLTLVSKSEAGDPAIAESYAPIFVDDTHILLSSFDGNLVDGADFGGIFLEDLTTGALTVLVANDTSNANAYANGLSDDGTKLTFISRSDALVAGGTTDTYDVFVKDLTNGTVAQASTASDGTGGNAHSEYATISHDGTMVAFSSYATNLTSDSDAFSENLFLKNLTTGETTCISLGLGGSFADGDSIRPEFSPDGEFVAFVSDADDLVPDDTNGTADVFLYSVGSGALLRITLPDGIELTGFTRTVTFSADGSQLVMDGAATPDLAGEFIVDLDLDGQAGGNDTLNGGTGDDILVGGGGADVMNGAGGKDVFRYTLVSDSTSSTFDTIVSFDAQKDSIDLGSVGAIDAAINSGSLSDASFDTDLAAAVDAAHLGGHHAVLFTANAGGRAGQTFLVIDANNDAGYQAGEDFVIRLQGATNMGSFSTDNFI